MNQPCLVIMAAGMGSRFGGPKQTTPVDEYGHFLLHYSLFDAYRAGFRKVVFVVKEDTAEEFRESVGPAVAAAFDVRYAYQKLDTLPAGYAVPAGRTKPWGTAHAVLCAAPEIDGPFAVINSDDYYGIEAYRLLYDFLAVPRPERSYAMVGFRLCNTVTANGSVSRGVCTERNGMLESITERTHIEQRGADAAYTEDGEHFIDLPGDTTVSMNFWGFSPLYLRELARRFPAFLDENLPRNPLKCEYFVPSIVDAQLRAGTADVTMLHTNDAWHGVTYHDDLPDVDISSWEYLIASQAHNISDYVPDVSKISGSQSTFDSRAVDALNALLKAARDAGWNPYIYCAYRPYLTQEQQYEDQVSENMRKGDTRDEAETAAARVAAPPGTSDHQTGLGADIVDQYYSSLSVDTVNARFLTWLADNCADYGFVIRYPSDKVSITGRNEPWHVRYVGDAAARFMTEHNLCLEEFVALYQ